MFELLIVFGLAVVGVVYTSYPGKGNAAEAAARNRAEPEDGVGIFGFDVAAKRKRYKVAEEEEASPVQTPPLSGEAMLHRMWDKQAVLKTDMQLGVTAHKRLKRAVAASRTAMAAPMPTPASLPPLIGDVPVIDDFDPASDRLVIEYRPQDAGSGRVGIQSDPDRPGAVRITLGGRCVALVLNGEGRLKPQHIELVPEHRAA